MTFAAGEPEAGLETPSLDGLTPLAIHRLSMGTGQLFASGESLVRATICLLDHATVVRGCTSVEHRPPGRWPLLRLASLLACASRIVRAVPVHPASGSSGSSCCTAYWMHVTCSSMRPQAPAPYCRNRLDIRVLPASGCSLLSLGASFRIKPGWLPDEPRAAGQQRAAAVLWRSYPCSCSCQRTEAASQLPAHCSPLCLQEQAAVLRRG